MINNKDEVEKGGSSVKFFTLFLLVLCLATFSFAIQMGTLSASPVYALKGDSFALSITLSPTSDVKTAYLMLYNSCSGSTETLYIPQIHGDTYKWYYSSYDSCDFRAQVQITQKSTNATLLSNIATFTTDIPAASVDSTIVYVPFITNSTQTWAVNALSVGSKALTFTTFSSPSGLSISPNSGSIQPGKSKRFEVSKTGFLLPGNIYVLDAFMDTNDPRINHSRYLLARVIMGPDGLVMTPIQISNDRVIAGSDVIFDFSIWKYDVTLNYAYVVWNTPKGSKILNIPPDHGHFSSSMRLTSPGTYTLSQVMINYMYKGLNNSITYYPNVKVEAAKSSKSMKLSLKNGTSDVGISLKSSSTPTVYAIDGTLKEKLYIKMAKDKNTWTASYTYADMPGPVTILSTFDGTDYVLSKSFERYRISGAQSINFNGGWISIPSGTFASSTIVSELSSTLFSNNLYKGFSNFNPVSNCVSLVSKSDPWATITYHLHFDTSAVKGLFDNLKVYKLANSGEWKASSTKLSIENDMAIFGAKTGTYALGLAANVDKSSKPTIKFFTAIPRKLIGSGNVQFILTVSKDCYYKLLIYDMRGRVVALQSGKALRTLGNLLYVLNSTTISNGLYVAVVAVGPSANSITETVSMSFAIVR